MNPAELGQKLIHAARSCPPSDHVPYGFEKRIVALLRPRPVLDHCAFWARALSRGAVACVVVMLLLVAFAVFDAGAPAPTNDLSQDFENTMLAAVDQDTDPAQ